MMEERDKIELRFWQSADLLNRIAGAADSFYELVQTWLEKVSGTVDAESAPIKLVELLGWERDIERFSGEDDTLFRKRVKYALVNARDAGSKAGFARIWERLGLGNLEQTERFDAENWDVIRLRIDEEVFGKYAWLLDTLVRMYGRTCRRYELESLATAQVGIRPFNFDLETECSLATLES
ncbi:MAG: hypothetical protein PHH77_03555 [Victivallaceae bacterium]|nr:hypothetical protein [Victivallaceae bacterium]